MTRGWRHRSDPEQPIWRLLFYRFCRNACTLALTLIYRLRVFGMEHIPPEGPLLVVCNHQSHLDPPVVGSGVRHRHLVSIARVGLFNNALFSRIILALNAIPIRQGEPDTSAIRQSLDQLKRGRALLIFAEGSRSPDGAMRPFQRGTWLLMARSRCPVLPVALEGCYDAWPRHRSFPRFIGCRVAVMYGEPIDAATLRSLGPDAGLSLLEQTIDTLRLRLREKLRLASAGRYPAPGPGDLPFRSDSSPSDETDHAPPPSSIQPGQL